MKKIDYIILLILCISMIFSIGACSNTENKQYKDQKSMTPLIETENSDVEATDKQTQEPEFTGRPDNTSEIEETSAPENTQADSSEPTATIEVTQIGVDSTLEVTSSATEIASLAPERTTEIKELPTPANKPTLTPIAKPTPAPTAKPTATPTPKPTPTPTPSGGSYYKREESYIYFGSYPQSEVTDSSLKSSLTSAAGSTSNWTSCNYYISGSTSSFMKYNDVTFNGNKYRGVYFTQYRPHKTDYSSSADNSNQADNGYNTNTIYWFKFEPIKWKILSESNGDAFLVTDMLIDSQDYNHTLNNNYANSYIRSWLNSTFLSTAFSSTEQSKIKTTNVDNSVSSTGYSSNPNACSNTNDKIFLLSYKEVMNSSYGFSSDSSRVKKLTSYAKAQGAYSNSGAGWWWLRSPFYNDGNGARGVSGVGYVYSGGVDYTDRGVAPALHLTL